MDKIQISGIVIVVFLVFIYISYTINIRNQELCNFNGFYTSSPKFNQEAELDTFTLYINSTSMYDTDPNCYIFVQTDDEVIINHKVKMEIESGFMSWVPFKRDMIETEIKFNWLDETRPVFFNSNQTLTYYPEFDKIVLSSGDMVTAVLYKNNIMSDLKEVMPEFIKTLKPTDEIL